MRYFLFILIIIFFSGCGRQKSDRLITKKIQYDVNIKSPDPEWDWWIQNIVGPDREKLVDIIMDGALKGKFQAYDYFGDSLTPAQVKSMLSDTFYLSYKREEPPYETFDTAVIFKINRNDILRIRFMEEWRINPETMEFHKKVLGIGPVARRVDMHGTERWQPLFWISTDKEFLKSFGKEY